MTKEDGFDAGMPKACDSACALVIAKVAVASADPHLKLMRVRPAHQHIYIVIGFNHYYVGLAGKGYGFVGNAAGIGHNEKLPVRYGYGKAAGVGGVVGDGEVAYLHIANGVPSTFFQYPAAGSYVGSGEGMACQGIVQLCGCVNRLAQALAERAKIADMVHVVMGNQYALDGVHAKAAYAHVPLEGANGSTGVYKYGLAVTLKVVAIAAASAGKTHELKLHPLFLLLFAITADYSVGIGNTKLAGN